MKQMLFDKIRESMAIELESYGDEFDGDVAITISPGPQGAMLIAIFVVTAKSGLLGGGLCVSSIVDPDPMMLLNDPDRMKHIVLQGVTQAREIRSQQLSDVPGAVLGRG